MSNFIGMYPWTKIKNSETGGLTPAQVQEMINASLEDYAKTTDLDKVSDIVKEISEKTDTTANNLEDHVNHKGAPFDLGHVMSSEDYRGEKMATAVIDAFGQIRYKEGLSSTEVNNAITTALTPYSTTEDTGTMMDTKLVNYVSNQIFGIHTGQVAGDNLGHVKAHPAKGDENISVNITSEGYLVAKASEGAKVDLPFYNVKDNPNIFAEEGHDNTRPIQDVIMSLFQRGGGTIYFPEGVFEITGLELLPKVSIVGAGMGSTVFRCTEEPRKLKGVFHFPKSATCSSFQKFTIDGNHKRVSGIYFEPTGYMGSVGRDEVGHLAERIIADEFGIKTPHDSVPHKNIFFENICICYCGDGSGGSCYEDVDTYYGVRIRDDVAQSELPPDDQGVGCYNIDFNHCWIYGCDNGMITYNTDSLFNGNVIECCRWAGWFVGGGNCKYNNNKVIWCGMEYYMQDEPECPAVALDTYTGQHTFCNLELQDNHGGVDLRIQGENHSFTNLVLDGTQQSGQKLAKLQLYGKGHKIDARLTTYASTRASYGVMGNCDFCIIDLTGDAHSAQDMTSSLSFGLSRITDVFY